MSIGKWLIYAITATSCISVLSAFFKVGVWPVEVLTAFLSQATLAIIVVAILAVRGKQYGAGVALLFMSFFGIMTLLPNVASEPLMHKYPCCVQVNIGHANLFSHGRGINQVKKWVAKKDIDILELTELPGAEEFDLAKEFPEFPFALKSRQHGRRKVAILSKFPLEMIDADSSALIIAGAQIDERTVLTIVSTHPTIPISPRHMESRNAAIRDAFEEAAKRQPSIVVGDFNATPWSPVLATSRRRHDFKRSSRGAFQSTWITPLPILGLPIDHIYASYETDVLEAGGGPFIFSDHWPVYARISVAVSDYSKLSRAPGEKVESNFSPNRRDH